jgi:hypothetical protein
VTVEHEDHDEPGAATLLPAPVGRWFAFAVMTGRWLPWLVAPVIFAGTRWVAGSTDVVSVVVHVLLVLWAYPWAGLAQDAVRLTRAGIRVRGRILGELVTWQQLGEVLTDDETVVLRVVDPDDAILLHAKKVRPLLASAPTPGELVAAIEAARPAPTDRVPPGPRYLLTPAAAVTIAWAAAYVGGALLH